MEYSRYNSVLSRFLTAVSEAPQFSPAHVSVFVAIVNEAQQQGSDPVALFARDLMKKSKISGVATYHRIIKDLREFGFIKYEPSYNPLMGSLFYVLNTK